MMEDILMQLFRAFVIGGLICVIGQILLDVANLTPAHTMSVLVVSGSVLSIVGVYPLLVEFAGFGAMLPISNFGNILVEGAKAGAAEGFFGILGGLLSKVSAGVSSAVIAGFFVALVFRPKA